MSVQSDIEMLSIRAMETYARKNHLSGQEAIDIFHQNQIFEKILIQHEYLHQVDFEEVMEYVEQAIIESSHELTVFHGTTKKFEKIDLKKSHNRRVICSLLGRQSKNETVYLEGGIFYGQDFSRRKNTMG